MDLTARFVDVVHRPEPEVPLDEAALLIAAHAHPGLDLGAQLAHLDALAEGVWAPTLDALRKRLFVELGFTGNDGHYYDAGNSYLDTVLERRVGVPITLAVLMLEVGRRIGVPLAGVSMPGHFLVRDKVDPGVFVDPYARGAVLDERGCRLRFLQVHGPDAEFDPTFLQPVGKHAIVSRMLANLERIATMDGERAMLVWVLSLRAAMPDAGAAEHRKLSSVLASTGRYGEAADVLEELALELADRTAAGQLAIAASRLRAKLN